MGESRQQYDAIRHDPVRYDKMLERKRMAAAERRRKDPSYESARHKRWRLNNPKAKLISLANSRVQMAIKAGTLVRPTLCSRCNVSGKIEAHHPSYAQEDWLKVVWVCSECHDLEHNPNRARLVGLYF